MLVFISDMAACAYISVFSRDAGTQPLPTLPIAQPLSEWFLPCLRRGVARHSCWRGQMWNVIMCHGQTRISVKNHLRRSQVMPCWLTYRISTPPWPLNHILTGQVWHFRACHHVQAYLWTYTCRDLDERRIIWLIHKMIEQRLRDLLEYLIFYPETLKE